MKKKLYKIEKVLFMGDKEGSEGIDIAFLQVTGLIEGNLKPIPFYGGPLILGSNVAVIGFPGDDSEIEEKKRATIRKKIFQDILGVKRIASGILNGIEGNMLFHDASTLTGSSGSVVLDV